LEPAQEGVVRHRLDDFPLDQAVGPPLRHPAGVAVGGLRAGQGEDHRLGLAVALGRPAASWPFGPGRVRPRGGEPAPDGGSDPGGDSQRRGDLLIGLVPVGPEQSLDPVPLPKGERPDEPLLPGRPRLIRQPNDVSLLHPSSSLAG
jgi:hypothetical protein